jgi:photosystem II stability/assembly factor-like uncharacterized protein
MKTNLSITWWLALVALAIFNLQPSTAFAQGTAFTYQGQLQNNGSPASGIYDLRFTIYDAITNGSLIAGPLTNSATGVTNGLFTVTLDFGGGVFTGPARWLQLDVRTNGGGAFATLFPFQPILPVPYAIFANTSSNLSGTVPAAQLSAGTANINISGNAATATTATSAASATTATTANSFSGSLAGNVTGTQGATVVSTVGGQTAANVAGGASAANAATSANTANTIVKRDGSGNFAAGTITASNFSGNGAGLTGIPGTFTWQNVTGTSQQAASNTGYLANNAGQVSITLPPSANVGDIVRVSGNGVGNWKVIQNAGQSIIAGNIVGMGTVMGGSAWTPRENNRVWVSVASSADGRKLVAVDHGNYIHTSTDSGITWTQRGSGGNGWQSVASSADGSKLVAVVLGGYIYTSTDSGVTWTQRGSSQNWQSVASSSDGSKLVAVVLGGYIYTSTDSGVTWTQRGSSQNWDAVASSSDGSKLVAIINNFGYIYTSTDSGVTWTNRGSIFGLGGSLAAVASSADGSKLVAVGYGGLLYTSTDSGITWTQRESSLGDMGWYSVACSADGSKLVAVVYGGQIYTSKDYGVSWTPCASSQNWYSVASSADASKLVAGVNGGQIYTSIATTTLGISGYLYGEQGAATELQYVGNGVWIPVSHEDPISAY